MRAERGGTASRCCTKGIASRDDGVSPMIILMQLVKGYRISAGTARRIVEGGRVGGWVEGAHDEALPLVHPLLNCIASTRADSGRWWMSAPCPEEKFAAYLLRRATVEWGPRGPCWGPVYGGRAVALVARVCGRTQGHGHFCLGIPFVCLGVVVFSIRARLPHLAAMYPDPQFA